MEAFAMLSARIAFSILLAACEETRVARLGEPFKLGIGDAVRIEDAGVTLVFEKVVNDSRCPKDVTCIRAGEAIVHLSAADDTGAKAVLEIAVPPGGASLAAKFQDFLVTVLELDPQKESRKAIDPSSYVARVKVARTQ